MCKYDIKDTISRTTTPTLLVTKCLLDKSNIEKKYRHLFSDDLYNIFEVDATNEATFFENVYRLSDAAQLQAAVRVLNPKLQFDTSDGVTKMVWHVSKAALYNSL